MILNISEWALIHLMDELFYAGFDSMKKTVAGIVLASFGSIASAHSFAIARSPVLPIEISSGESKEVSVHIRNMGEDIFRQNPALEGSAQTALDVSSADRWIRQGKPFIGFTFDVDITRNDQGVISTHQDGTLHVLKMDVGNEKIIFPKSEDVVIKLTLRNDAVIKVPLTSSYTMYFRFYDASCSAKIAEPFRSQSKHAECILYSLPLVTQNVRLLPRRPPDPTVAKDLPFLPLPPELMHLKSPK